MIHDLIVIGAGPTGLSIASDARQSGVEKILVLEPGEHAIPADAVGRFAVSVRYQAAIEKIEAIAPDRVLVETAEESFTTTMLVQVAHPEYRPPEFPFEASIAERVHVRRIPADVDLAGADVLVVGRGDDAVSAVVELLAAGANVVLAFSGRITSLSRLARETIASLEHRREVTALWHGEVEEVVDSHGFPMVYWTGRMTPALQFDHIVTIAPAPHSHDHDHEPHPPYVIVDPLADEEHALGPARIWETLTAMPGVLEGRRVVTARPSRTREVEQLRLEHYNATITHFDHSHDDLWVIRIQPDRADVAHRAGQYTTIGLGYWEPRVDDADEQLDEDGRQRLIRRSYSISSPVVDDVGYLLDPRGHEWMEFYIVLVRPSEGRIPALTPRLAAKRVGDRIYLGPKIAGRYTLDAVDHPDLDVVFLSTGTGEAPHNAMLNELLRKGHRGGIVSVVSVRHLRDLGYLDTHRELEARFPNYHYVTLPTREPGIPKRYVQDVIESGELADLLPSGLDPRRTHVYLCGNPAMIGPPEWDGPAPVFDDPNSAVALLHGLGFTPDRRKRPGNVHFEEYW
jgi:ferredoxin--NADP+ reductase